MHTDGRPAVVEARDRAYEGEEALGRGDYPLAAAKFSEAADLFMTATQQVPDLQTVESLKLLSISNRRKAQELHHLMQNLHARFIPSSSPDEAMDTLGSDIEDSSMLLSGSFTSSKGDWENAEESLIYDANSSGEGLPMMFVYTKNTPPQYLDDDWGERSELMNEVNPDSEGAWHKMMRALDQLLENIIPRFPTSQQNSDVQKEKDPKTQDRGADKSITDSFFFVPSDSRPDHSTKGNSTTISVEERTKEKKSLSELGKPSQKTERSIPKDEELIALKSEVARLNFIIDTLKGKNSQLVKENQERANVRKENELIRNSIVRFRKEVEKQALHHRLHASSLSRSTASDLKNTDPELIPSHRSLRLPKSKAKMISSTTYSPPVRQSNPVSSLASGLSPAFISFTAERTSPIPISTPTSSIKSLRSPSCSLPAEELENSNKSMYIELKKMEQKFKDQQKQMQSTYERRLQQLVEENQKQKKVIEHYDEKWRMLEKSARQKMKQRRTPSAVTSHELRATAASLLNESSASSTSFLSSSRSTTTLND